MNRRRSAASSSHRRRPPLAEVCRASDRVVVDGAPDTVVGMSMQALRRHVHSRLPWVAVAALAVATAGCATPVGTVTGEGRVGTMPTTATASATATASVTAPTPTPTPTADPAASPSGPDPVMSGATIEPTPVPSTPAQIARALGLTGLVELIEEDPGAAGERGRDLLRELERVVDRPEEDRIDRALERLARWEDDLDPEVAEAARVVLTDLRGSDDRPDEGGPDHDDHDDDDD